MRSLLRRCSPPLPPGRGPECGAADNAAGAGLLPAGGCGHPWRCRQRGPPRRPPPGRSAGPSDRAERCPHAALPAATAAMDDIFTQCREGNAVAVRLWLDNTENDLNQG